MKETIEGVISIPFIDKFVVRVFRCLDRYHVPAARDYYARYSEEEKVKRLNARYLKLLTMVNERVIEERINRWNSL